MAKIKLNDRLALEAIKNPKFSLVRLSRSSSSEDLDNYIILYKNFVATMIEIDPLHVNNDAEEEFKDNLDWIGDPKKNFSFLLKENDVSIGLIDLIYIGDGDSGFDSTIISLFISKEHRGKGYSKLAIDKAVEEIRKDYKAIKYVRLNVYSTNLIAKKAYVKMGFKPYTETLYKKV